jgi:hypothetical protein
MAETRREVFKSSILSAFGLMAVATVAKASRSSTEFVLVRAKNSSGMATDILLSVREDRIRALEIKPAPQGRSVPTSPFDIEEVIVDSGNFTLSPLGSQIFTVGSGSLCVENGTVSPEQFKKLSPAGWNEVGGAKNKCLETGSGG